MKCAKTYLDSADWRLAGLPSVAALDAGSTEARAAAVLKRFCRCILFTELTVIDLIKLPEVSRILHSL